MSDPVLNSSPSQSKSVIDETIPLLEGLTGRGVSIISIGEYELEEHNFFQRLAKLVGNERAEYTNGLLVGVLLCFDNGVVSYTYYFPAAFYKGFIDYTQYSNFEYNLLFTSAGLGATLGPLIIVYFCSKIPIMTLKFYLLVSMAITQIVIVICIRCGLFYFHCVCRTLVGAIGVTIINLIYTCLADWFPNRSATALLVANASGLFTLAIMYFIAVYIPVIPNGLILFAVLGVVLSSIAILSTRYQSHVDETFTRGLPLLLQSSVDRMSNVSLSDLSRMDFSGICCVIAASFGFTSIAIFRTLGAKIMTDGGYFTFNQATYALGWSMTLSIPVSFFSGGVIDMIGHRMLIAAGCVCLQALQTFLICFLRPPWLQIWMISLNDAVADSLFVGCVYSAPVVLMPKHMQSLVFTSMNAMCYLLWSLVIPLYDWALTKFPHFGSLGLVANQFFVIAVCFLLWFRTTDRGKRSKSDAIRKESDEAFRISLFNEWEEFAKTSLQELNRDNSLELFVRQKTPRNSLKVA